MYGLANCDSCRKARNWLARKDIAFDFVDYRAERIAADALKRFADVVGGWDTFVNRSSTTWRTLPETRKSPGSDAEWTLLIKEYPPLVRRPLLIFDDGRVHQGFSDNAWKKLFA